MSEIKQCFKSHHPDGLLVQVDFSQLEVCCLAVIADDTVLITELNNGEDIHTNNTMMLHPHLLVDPNFLNGPEFKELRRKTKEFTFQLQYGAGAKSIAQALNIPQSEASRYKRQFYEKYTGIRKWHSGLDMEAAKCAQTGTERTQLGFPAREVILQSKTGRRYKHIQHDGPDWNANEPGFSPTELRNYRVQGLAVGDIQPLANCIVYRKMLKDKLWKGIKLINTVHDSLIMDVQPDHIAKCFRLVCSAYGDIKSHVERVYSMRFPAPLNYDVEVGFNLQDLTKVDINDIIDALNEEEQVQYLLEDIMHSSLESSSFEMTTL